MQVNWLIEFPDWTDATERYLWTGLGDLVVEIGPGKPATPEVTTTTTTTIPAVTTQRFIQPAQTDTICEIPSGAVVSCLFKAGRPSDYLLRLRLITGENASQAQIFELTSPFIQESFLAQITGRRPLAASWRGDTSGILISIEAGEIGSAVWQIDVRRVEVPASTETVTTIVSPAAPAIPAVVNTYRGGGHVLSIGALENSTEGADRRLTASIILADLSLRRQALTDPGPLQVILHLVGSNDQGITWNRLGPSFAGRLSNPTISNGVYTIEIENYGGDLDRVRDRTLSHDGQITLYPGDNGLSYMATLSEGIDTKWPP